MNNSWRINKTQNDLSSNEAEAMVRGLDLVSCKAMQILVKTLDNLLMQFSEYSLVLKESMAVVKERLSVDQSFSRAELKEWVWVLTI